MGPLDIPRLNWEDRLGNGAVAGAYQDLNHWYLTSEEDVAPIQATP
jgi:hypothetical protein